MALLRKCQPSGILPVSQPSAQENRSGKRSQRRRNVTASGPMELLVFKLGQSWRAGAAAGMRESCSAFTRSFCATAAACRGWRPAVSPASLPTARSSIQILRRNFILSQTEGNQEHHGLGLVYSEELLLDDRGEHIRIPPQLLLPDVSQTHRTGSVLGWAEVK